MHASWRPQLNILSSSYTSSTWRLTCIRACAQDIEYPQIYRYILHPCVSWPGSPNMCGGLHTAAGNLRFDSYLTAENVVLMLIYEVRSPLASQSSSVQLSSAFVVNSTPCRAWARSARGALNMAMVLQSMLRLSLHHPVFKLVYRLL